MEKYREGQKELHCVVKEVMAEVEVTEEDTEYRNNRIWKIRRGDPWREKPKEEEDGMRISYNCYASYNYAASCVFNNLRSSVSAVGANSITLWTVSHVTHFKWTNLPIPLVETIHAQWPYLDDVI